MAMAIMAALLAAAVVGTVLERRRADANLDQALALMAQKDRLDEQIRQVRGNIGDATRQAEHGGRVAPADWARLQSELATVDRQVQQLAAAPGARAAPSAGAWRQAMLAFRSEVGRMLWAARSGGSIKAGFPAFLASLRTLENTGLVLDRHLSDVARASAARSSAVAQRWTMTTAVGAALAIVAVALFAWWVQACIAGPVEQIARFLSARGADAERELALADRQDEIGALAQAATAYHALAARNRQVIAELDHLARHDPLTGLANRRAFEERLSQIADAGRPFALLWIDVDGFKAINDSLGHAAGDMALARLAARLRGACHPDDVLARVGGDEFALLQLDPAQPVAAEQLAARLLAATERRAGPDVAGFSIGVATYPLHGDCPRTLCAAADRALYAAKRGGRRQHRMAVPAGDVAVPQAARYGATGEPAGPSAARAPGFA